LADREEPAMRIRHRPPSIFNLSMVDVFCCALGCVLLLWLWHLRKAQDFQSETEEQNRQAAAMLAGVTEDRDGAYLMLVDLQNQLVGANRARVDLDKEMDRHRLRIVVLESQLDDSKKREAMSAKDLADLRGLLEKERSRTTDLDKEKSTLLDRIRTLQALADRLPNLEKELTTARTSEKDLTALLRKAETALATAMEKEKVDAAALRAKDIDLADLARRVQALTTDKADLDKRVAALSKSLVDRADEMKTGQANLTATQTTLATSQARVRDLEKELAATIRTLLNLQDEKKALEAQVAKAKATSEARFEGIALTGRRVVFLVDVSGSMIETTDGKPNPEKWKGVVSTVIKVMKSLPDLESYQLVIFSRAAKFPLGQGGQWLRYDSKNSPDLVERTLLADENKPDGGTNMYAGLEAAFRMRTEPADRKPLDTVYLFSDGLPNQGTGVDPALARTLSETELGRRLGDYVRKTLNNEWNRPIPNMPKVHIHSIGFYYDSPDVGAFLWALSRDNEGSFVGMSKP
jgi:hypothetical protein